MIPRDPLPKNGFLVILKIHSGPLWKQSPMCRKWGLGPISCHWSVAYVRKGHERQETDVSWWGAFLIRGSPCLSTSSPTWAVKPQPTVGRTPNLGCFPHESAPGRDSLSSILPGLKLWKPTPLSPYGRQGREAHLGNGGWQGSLGWVSLSDMKIISWKSKTQQKKSAAILTLQPLNVVKSCRSNMISASAWQKFMLAWFEKKNWTFNLHQRIYT